MKQKDIKKVETFITGERFPTLFKTIDGKSFSDIGKAMGVTRQAVQNKFSSELEKLMDNRHFMTWFKSQTMDGGDPYAFLDFTGAWSTVLIGVAKKLFGYHKLHSYAVKDKTTKDLLTKEIFDAAEKMSVPHVTDDPEQIGFNDILTFAWKPQWKKSFTTEYNAEGLPVVTAINKYSVRSRQISGGKKLKAKKSVK